MSTEGVPAGTPVRLLTPLPKLIAITPFERPDVRLAVACARAGALGVVNLGFEREAARAACESIERASLNLAVRLTPATVDIALPQNVDLVVLDRPQLLQGRSWGARRVVTQICSVEEALEASAAGCGELIVKGHDAGGRVGPEGMFVLLQRVLDAVAAPVWVQGGIGLHTAAAVLAAGARGFVLDSQLALFREAHIPDPLRRLVAAMDGSETIVVDGYRVHARSDFRSHEGQSTAEHVEQLLGSAEDGHRCVALGQDAAFARSYAERFPNVSECVRALGRLAAGQLRLARVLKPLRPNNDLAVAHSTAYPIVQGPMTRVSDRAEFAAVVAQSGALPFIALSLLRADAARTLLDRTSKGLGSRPWGVGLLGFAPDELRAEQIEVICESKPPFAIIAGGKPAQAQMLEAQGISTYLHVPSPRLLDIFIREGARKFVFEGRECGGHVGPRTSAVLWEMAVERLLAFDRVSECSVLLAGGIHDARSSAMAATVLAPLAARGVKVGVLMGTAYLFTQEAVESGAILPEFQRAALQCTGTVLLETGVGHSTRAARTEYVEDFHRERRRLLDAGEDPKAVWAMLEAMNVGRLRIASKGVERRGDELVEVGQEEQRQTGLYMLGDVAALRERTTTLDALHREVAEAGSAWLERVPQEDWPVSAVRQDIAIVGMACLFPGADDVETYWRNILTGTNCIGEVPATRWDPELFFDAKGGKDSTPSRWGGFLPAQLFEPAEFGIPPRSLASIDPAQLLALQVIKRALIDAGLRPEDTDSSRTAVILGAEASVDLSAQLSFRAYYRQHAGELPEVLDEHLPEFTEDVFPGVLANVISGRATNRLDLCGTNYTVNAACASSLASIDAACKELALNAADTVVAGGIDLHNSLYDYLMFASVRALSPTGQCRTFDQSADGIVLGEGVGAVVLKRLEDARREGLRIYAVIKGVGASSDGRSMGLTAPREEGQTRALTRAYERAGVNPASLGLIEAHGTGTVVGDRTELASLTAFMFEAGGAPSSCVLGSVKSQIGHTKCAAGVAGLIKAALSIHHGVLPPTGNLQRPNAFYAEGRSPFAFLDESRPWSSESRRAGVSAFGFGGTNFHVVLEEAPNDAPAAQAPTVWPFELLLFRGRDLTQALATVRRVLPYLTRPLRVRLADVAASVARCDQDEPVQLALAVGSCDELRQKLERVVEASPSTPLVPGVYLRAQGQHEGQLAFLFPGQGSQRPGMAADVCVWFPQSRKWMARARDILPLVHPPAAFDDGARQAQVNSLADTRVAQPALGFASMVIADLLAELGIHPTMVAGHSYGEVAALCQAGAIAEEALLPLSQARAAAMLASVGDEPGTMAVVLAGAEQVEPLLAGADGVVLANRNSPSQCVISGTRAGIARAIEVLHGASLRTRAIPVAAAFHSPLLRGADVRFHGALDGLGPIREGVAVFSNAEAAPYPHDVAATRDLLAKQLVSEVRFQEMVEAMYRAGARTFIEVGPGATLTGLVQQILGSRQHLAVATDRAGGSGHKALLDCLAQLSVNGIVPDLDRLFEGRLAQPVDLTAGPMPLSPTAWIVDGHYGRPARGNLPAAGLKPAGVRPLASANAPMVMAPRNGREHAIIEYLAGVRALVETQRQVMLQYLGTDPAQASAVLQPSAPLLAMTAEPAPIDAHTASAKQPFEALLAVLSERTGYPIEMLEPQLDLEADLGIDSIKRTEIMAELAHRLHWDGGGAREERFQEMAKCRSLAELRGWLDARAPSQREAELQQQPAEPSARGAQPRALDVLVGVVSDRTGYPPEMLELDLDLEADLGIDSIKRMEIADAVNQQLRLWSDSERKEEHLTELAKARTLRAIAAWLESLQSPATASPRVAAPAPASAAILGHTAIERLIMSVEREQSRAARRSLAGSRVALRSNGGALAEALAEQLGACGATVSTGEEIEEGCDALIDLGALDPDTIDPVKALFAATKHALACGLTTVIAAVRRERVEREDAVFSYVAPCGIAGFVRSLVVEYPALRARAVAIDPAEPAEWAAQRLLTELAFDDDATEVISEATERVTSRPVRAARSDEQALHLDAQSVIVLTGGARGITAKIAIELARRFKCHLELIGRTPLPPADEDPATAGMNPAELRRGLSTAARDNRSFADIERECRKLLVEREIRQTLRDIRATGASVRYHEADVRDGAAVARVIGAVYEVHGRIDGVIHGAGMIEDKLIDSKTSESFARVYDTKVIGARELLSHLRGDERFVAFFSSIASVFGNRGQTDYAAANDYLDKLAVRLAAANGRRVLSVNWGPWSGVGMVSPELERVYRRTGVGLIDPDDGADQFIEELTRGTDAQVVLLARGSAAHAE